jgi:hypothetical protein
MALQAQNVVVAGTGNVYAAPENTALPNDLVTPLPAAWLDLGYVSDDGVQFTFSREQEDINAWQSAEPVRVLTTSEPKTIAFDLLEFDRTTILLAFRGGSISGASAPFTYNPPTAGVDDVRAMVIDGKDGVYTFRFCFPRVSMSGDVAFQLLRTDAVKPTFEFSVLASSTPWKIISDLPGWATGAGLFASGTTHAELDAAAQSMGHEWSASGMTVADKQAELTDAAAVPA